MKFRKSNLQDIDAIMTIIEQAKSSMKKRRINQWQDGYPNSHIISQDIEQENSYVLEIEERIVATAAVSFNGEQTYDEIKHGEWLTQGDNYAVIHRLAVTGELLGKGISHVLMAQIQSLCAQKGVDAIRVDTHRDNLSMRNFLEKHLYSYCGMIFLTNGNPRMAYEKSLISVFPEQLIIEDQIMYD